jgi:MFS family permease
VKFLRRLAVDTTPLRESPAFRRLWLGQAISFVGRRMTLVALPVQVYQLTGSPLMVGLLSFAQFVPLMSLTIVGGVLADAGDRRRLLLASETAMGLCVVGLVVNAGLPHPQVWACFLFGALSWSAFSFGAGSARSLTPRLVSREQLPAAAALNGVYSQLGAVLGPAFAGILIHSIGLSATYAIDLATSTAAIAGVASLPSIAPFEDAATPGLRALREGFAFIRTQRVILAFFLIDSTAMVFGMPNALFPAVADRIFRDPSAVGYLFAAPSAGAFVAALLSGWAGRLRRQGVAVVIAASAWGAAMASFGLTHTLWLGLVFLAVAGASDQVSAIFRSTMMMTLAPDHLRGRLSGIEFAQVASTPALGNLEAGVVASLTSLRFSIVSGGVACVAATVLLGLAFPALLGYDSRRVAPDPLAA